MRIDGPACFLHERLRPLCMPIAQALAVDDVEVIEGLKRAESISTLHQSTKCLLCAHLLAELAPVCGAEPFELAPQAVGMIAFSTFRLLAKPFNPLSAPFAQRSIPQMIMRSAVRVVLKDVESPVIETCIAMEAREALPMEDAAQCAIARLDCVRLDRLVALSAFGQVALCVIARAEEFLITLHKGCA